MINGVFPTDVSSYLSIMGNLRMTTDVPVLFFEWTGGHL